MTDWEPTPEDIAWVRRLLMMIKDGGTWGLPGAQAAFTFHHSAKEYELNTEMVTDQETVDRTKKVLGILGWEERG